MGVGGGGVSVTFARPVPPREAADSWSKSQAGDDAASRAQLSAGACLRAGPLGWCVHVCGKRLVFIGGFTGVAPFGLLHRGE